MAELGERLLRALILPAQRLPHSRERLILGPSFGQMAAADRGKSGPVLYLKGRDITHLPSFLNLICVIISKICVII